jgi:hypothetical protein
MRAELQKNTLKFLIYFHLDLIWRSIIVQTPEATEPFWPTR